MADTELPGGLPPDFTSPGNIVSRAVRLFREKTGFPQKAVKIRIQKNIPLASGLGGGSSDAAAVLKALNGRLREPLADKTLLDMGSELGADVPFFLKDEPLLTARGKGEKLSLFRGERIPPYVLLVVPPASLSTARVFKELDLTKEASGTKLKTGSGNRPPLGRNALFPAALSLAPVIAEAVKLLEKNCPGPAGLSGSGPALWGLFESPVEAGKALAKVKRSGYFIGVFAII
ncbi:MAG: hypothetical protein LBR53_04160 [Deltaproteobacteria bacterium]|nr:hypothetical protein [Deltaproteobacteria bacterium]